MTAAPEVVTLGEAMVLLYAEPSVPLAVADRYRRSVAGAEANVAVGLSRLGHRTAFIGRVGADQFGDVILRTLRAEGVDVSAVRVDPDAPTGLLVRDCHAARPIEVAYYRAGSAGSRISPEDLDASLVAGARVLHITGITPLLSDRARAATQAAVEAARAAGVTVSFDPNVRRKLAPPERAAAVLAPFAALADIVLTGAGEATVVSGRSDADAASAWFLEQGARLVVTKRGADGSGATDGTNTWTQAAGIVPVVDPVGAGDAFDAGYLSAFLRGLDPARCLREASVVAGLQVQVAGDLEGLPTSGERDTALPAGEVTRR